MVKEINIYTNSDHLAEEVASEISSWINNTIKIEGLCTIALSGGKTPIKLFNIISTDYSDSIDWHFVHIFWVDERCVSPSDPDSNYGNAMLHLLTNIDIPAKNIHRIKGEFPPEKEQDRYSYEISNYTISHNKMPVFDLVLLGIGEDGHIASIFPNQIELIESYKICNVSFQPQTKQKRITLSGRIINNARKIVFMATGRNKSEVIAKILKNGEGVEKLPAYYISPPNGNIQWHLDKDAAILLNS